MPAPSGEIAEWLEYPYSATSNVIVNIPPLSFVPEIGDQAITAKVTTPLPTLPGSVYNVDTESSAWGDGLRGMYVKITRSGVPVFTGTLVNDNNTGELHLAGRNTGDTGESSFTAYDIQDNDDIEVYRVFVPQSFWSRIDPYTITAYKFFDEAYDTSGTYTRQTEYPPPVANIGSHQCITLAPGTTTTTVSGSAVNSFAWRAGENVTYLWNLSNAPAPSGFSTLSTCTWTGVTEGVHLMSCVITSTVTGKSSTAYRWIFVRGAVNPAAFSDHFPTVIEKDDGNRTGRKMTLLINVPVRDSGIDYGDLYLWLYTGAPVLVNYTIETSSDAWQSSQEIPNASFFGFIRQVDELGVDADGRLTYRVTVLSPALYLEEIPNARQTLQAVDPPTDWNEVTPTLCRVDFFPWFLIYYAAIVALYYADYIITTEDEPLPNCYAPAFNFPAGTLLGGVKSAIQYFAGLNFGSAFYGGFYLRRHPVYEGTSFRSLVPTVWTWTPGDVLPNGGNLVTLNPDRMVESRETTGKFLISGTTQPPTVKAARTNLFAPGHAVQSAVLPDYIVTSDSDGLTRLGHHAQRVNKPVQAFSFNALGKYNFIDPALMEWHAFDFSALSTDILADNKISRAIPETVSFQWDFSGRSIKHRQTVTVEPESTGLPGALDPLDLPSLYGTWKQKLKFKIDDGGAYQYLPDNSLNWSPSDDFNNTTRGTWVEGVGWVGDVFNYAGGGKGAYRAGVAIRVDFSSAALKSIVVELTLPQGDPFTEFIYMAFYYTAAGGQTQRGYMQQYGPVIYTQTFPAVTVTKVGFAVLAYNPSVNPTPPVIKKMILEGDGPNPF